MMVVHADKLRWLFWLRWKLFIRSFTREKGRIVTTVFLIVFGLPFVGGIAVGTYFAYRLLPRADGIEILFLVLTGVYLLWILLPLFEFSVNEGLDVSKLILFPLSSAELMMSLLFSTLLDIPMVGLLLIFAAVVAGWAISTPVVVLTVVAMLIFYTQVVGISQLVLALLMRTLQSRRFRDLSIILIILFSSLCSIFAQVVGRLSNLVSLEKLHLSSYLQWVPPGMTARAIQLAVQGNWELSFIWLAMSLLASLVVLYLWQLVVQRSLSAPESGGYGRTHRPRQREFQALASPAFAQNAWWQGPISPKILAIAGKELKYFWRDPQLKALLFQSLISGAFFIIYPLLGSGGARHSAVGSLFILFAPLAVFFSIFTLSYNTLGMERQSLTMLFLYPIEPQRILWGKNLAVFGVGLVELLLVVGLSAILSQSWSFVLPIITIGLAGIGVVLGTGNFTSVYLPQRMREIQRGFRASGTGSQQNGCMRAVLSLVMMAVTVIVLIPVALALLVPMYFHTQWIWVFSIPGALAYGIAFHQVVTRLVAPRVVEKAPEILAITTRE